MRLQETAIGRRHRLMGERERAEDKRLLSPEKFAKKWNPFGHDYEMPDDFMAVTREKRRESNSIKRPEGDDLARFHELLDKYGMKGMLAALRQHADDLSQVEDFDVTVEDSIDTRAMEELADNLENFINQVPL